MITNNKILKITPAICLVIYLFLKLVFPDITSEYNLFILFPLIVISGLSFIQVVRKEPIENVRKRKKVQFVLGLAAVTTIMIYYLNSI